jgi:hypothetical protein
MRRLVSLGPLRAHSDRVTDDPASARSVGPLTEALATVVCTFNFSHPIQGDPQVPPPLRPCRHADPPAAHQPLPPQGSAAAR